MSALEGWRHYALCQGADYDVFFPIEPRAGRGAAQGMVTAVPAEARVLCRACPVQPECLDHGVRYERDGVWGGASEAARELARRERGITIRFREDYADPDADAAWAADLYGGGIAG